MLPERDDCISFSIGAILYNASLFPYVIKMKKNFLLMIFSHTQN